MTRHAVWWQGSRLSDAQRRYSVLFASGIPRERRDDALWVVPVCFLDAHPEGSSLYDTWVRGYDAWLRDENGDRVPGWGGPGTPRRAVNLSLKVPWDEVARTIILEALRQGAHGLHCDDLSIRPFFQGVGIDEGRWARNARVIARVARGGSINGGKDHFTPRVVMQLFSTCKLEGFRFLGPFDSPDRWNASGTLTWQDWLCGRLGWGPGIQGMVAKGLRVVLEGFFDKDWPAELLGQYARLLLATVLLSDHCFAMLHSDERGSWWHEPHWNPTFEASLEIGEPVAPAVRSGPLWTRAFENGFVVVNGTDRRRGGVEAYSARISVAGREV